MRGIPDNQVQLLPGGGVQTLEELLDGTLRHTAGAVMPRLTPVYIDSFGDVKASQANSLATSECVGVTLVASTLNGVVAVMARGSVTGTTGEWTAITGGALAPGEEYVVDPENAGQLITATALMGLTITGGWAMCRVGKAITSTTMNVHVKSPALFEV